MASFNLHLPCCSLINIYVPHDEVSRAKERLHELIEHPRMRECEITIKVAGSAAPMGAARQRVQQIELDSEGDVFTRAFVGLHDRLGVCAWSVVFAIAKDQFRDFQKAVGSRGGWKLNQKIGDLNHFISLQLDYDKPLARLSSNEEEDCNGK